MDKLAFIIPLIVFATVISSVLKAAKKQAGQQSQTPGTMRPTIQNAFGTATNSPAQSYPERSVSSQYNPQKAAVSGLRKYRNVSTRDPQQLLADLDALHDAGIIDDAEYRDRRIHL